MADGSPPGLPAPSGGSTDGPDDLGARVQDALGPAYQIEGRLGAGGFAVVYLVRDLNLKRKLAVKVLSPDLIASHSVLERFRREAETVAQLSHPHIVPLHFIGQKDDLVYLVMQCIDGGSLAARLEREKQLPIGEATRIFSEVASALAHAHKRGVVHRDIKPQNVLIDSETGRALVTDFGIARTAESGSLTATGMVVGTPAYLSPEQVTGEPSDHRADIYALGVMMYEMLAGQPPFTGPTPTAVLMKRLSGPPESLRTLRPDVPPALAELVDACLATDPNERLSNAGDIVRALTGASPVSGGHTTRSGIRVHRAKKRSNLVTSAVIAGVVLGGGALAYVLAGDARTDEVPAAVAPVDSGMVLIPAGTYTIGSNDGPSASGPAHPVQLGAFGIGKREVTVGEYQEFMNARGVAAPWATKPADDMPVTRVVHSEASTYCAWRHGGVGRLPTEEEWEAAARGIGGRLYPWGNTWNPAAANIQSSGRSGPAPVGSHPAGRTPEGVEDLIGNVWEWTSSPFRAYGDSTAAGTGNYVIRGGGFSAIQSASTATFRGQMPPVTDRANLAATGFRCAMPARAASTPR